ncbi:MAG: hypothetical protein JXI43_10600 [Tissierellales bacterium]|nr:hypothetical protein [Tissierellales bacterium]
MTTVEIYYDDLSETKQKELLKAVGAESPDDMNWGICPIAIFDLEEEDE